MNVVAHRKIFYTISALLVGLSIVLIVAFGLKLGIDFTGGSLLEVEFAGMRPSLGEIETRLSAVGLGGGRLQPTGERGLIVRLAHLDEAAHQTALGAIAGQELGLSERRFDTVGPAIGRELGRRAVAAIILVIVLIVSYIAWAFRRVSRPMASWKYGLVTVVALLHDVVIPAGFFAAAGGYYGFEVDTLFITAILTILGFSVHDTIVVFDRIRENLKRSSGGDFALLVGQSIRATFTRSLNTSLTVVLAMAAVALFGGASTRAFGATIIVGVIAGTYSSIFIASPLLVTWHQWRKLETRN